MEENFQVHALETTAEPSNHPKYSTFDWRLDLNNQTFSCDPDAMQLLFGQNVASVSAKQLFKLLPTLHRKRCQSVFKSVLKTGEMDRFHCCLLIPHAVFAYVEFDVNREATNVLSGCFSPRLVIGSRSDASDLFCSAFESETRGVVITDAQTRILACNRRFEQNTGYLLNEIVGLKTSIFNADKLSDEFYEAMWASVNRCGAWSGPIITLKADGSTVPQELSITAIERASGERIYIGVTSDLSKQLDKIDGLETDGIDLLTLLPSRDSFIAELEQQCEQAPDALNAVMLVLQPKFPADKAHQVKKQFASYLIESTKVASCGYLGNGRFAVCLSIAESTAEERIREVRKAVKSFFHLFKRAQGEIALALRDGLTGVSVLGVDANNPSRLISHATQALLELNQSEGKRIAFFDREMHQAQERKKALEVFALKCVKGGLVDVHFQPLVDIKSGQIDKFEALCRFPINDQLNTNTQEMVSVIEDLDLIVELDDMICHRAMSMLPELQKRFGAQVGLSVNRSLNSKHDIGEVLGRTVQLVDRLKIDPDRLTIEFTESAYFESDSYQESMLSAIREAGVLIAVDDFGTGSASFEYLNRSYFDVLKIDRVFVSGISEASRKYHLVASITKLAQKLGLRVVAEGVETEQEYQVIASLGVNYVQGYYFSKPMSLDDLRVAEDYCQLPDAPRASSGEPSLADLVSPNVSHLSPTVALSLIYQKFQDKTIQALPVVDEGECLGVIERASMNLHLTPTMGTDLESSKERNMWLKTANRIMSPPAAIIYWQTPLDSMAALLEQYPHFPWVLVDNEGAFKGIVEQRTVLKHLTSLL